MTIHAGPAGRVRTTPGRHRHRTDLLELAVTSSPTPARTPYCHKIRYGITGAPILDGDDMDGSHAPGVGVVPKVIELVYSPARDGKPARVDASVTGDWTRFGEPDGFGGQVATHFKDGPDGWPAWLAEEARLHDPADASSSVVGQATRDRIAMVLHEMHLNHEFDATADVDAVLAVLPPTADRAAVLREAADVVQQHGCLCRDRLRRLADEAQQQPETRPGSDLVEDYLRFLRGQGPEPDLSDLAPQQREAVAGQFEIVKALADRDPELPPLDRDPVALRLGLLDAAPAAECSAQHRNFDDGRLCIRAAQHRGDHIDERGFHWSDTVAVYPVGGGTFRSGVRPSAVGARQPDTQTPCAPAPMHAYRVSEIRDNVVRSVHGYHASLQGAFDYCETQERTPSIIPSAYFELMPAPGGEQWMVLAYAGPDDPCPETSDLVIRRVTITPDPSAVPGRSAATDTHKETQA